MDTHSTLLSICLLGTPEMRLSDTPLALSNLKARALLFYLATSGSSHSRDFLATLLWSEAASEEAHHSLRTSVYRIRQALGRERARELLTGGGEAFGLRPDHYRCDVIDFRRLLAAGDPASLRQAVYLYRGSFLQGFSLADAPAFDQWAQLEDARLSQACLDALGTLAGLAETRADWPAAIDYRKQMARIDPLSEDTQQKLIQAYLVQNEVGQALRQYRLFEALLQQELNIAPSAQTVTIYYEALRRQRSPSVFPVHAPKPSRLPPNALPFIGRDDLLQQLLVLSREAQSGRGLTVLLQGEGGIGKSRLLDELASRLAAERIPWTILQGACSPFDDLLSYGPFLEALQYSASDRLLAESEVGVPDARGRFFWNILQAIRSLSQSTALVLAIEDLQWANGSTLNLFGFLSMRLHHLPVVLIGTVQGAETIPALQRLVTLSRRRGELRLLTLAPLALESISGLIHASGLDLTSDETLAEWLHARSAGNPFLLTEIMAQLRTEGIIKPTANGWQLDATQWVRWRSTFKFPETAHDLVAWRLANLPPDARHLMDILAVSGQALAARVLRRLPGIDADALPSLADYISARGLIIEPPDGLLALPHHLLRETLLHHLSSLRRRSIHQQLAQALETDGGVPDSGTILRQIAMHAVAGEDIERARRYGMRILASLPLEYTGAETLDFVHHLYDLLAPSASNQEMALLTRALGTLHQSLGHLELAGDWHRQNLDWARKAGDLAAQALAHFEMGELALMSNDYQAAAQAAQQGLATIESANLLTGALSSNPNTLIGRGHRMLGAARAMEGSNLIAAEAELQKAVPIHRRTGNQGELCAALFELGNIAAQRGELQAALQLYNESALAAESAHIHYYLALARNNYAYHSLLLGRVDAAQQAATQGVRIAEAYELLAALLHLYSTQGEIHLYLAEWTKAAESFQLGLDLAEELGNLERQAGYRGGLALAALGNRDLDTGIVLLEEAIALIADQGYWHLRTRLKLWLAEIHLDRQEYAVVRPLLEETLAITRSHQRTLLLVQAQRLNARLLAAQGDWQAADGLFAETLRNAAGLGIDLEVARVQAAWGAALFGSSPARERGRGLIAVARAVFVACNARADLAALPPAALFPPGRQEQPQGSQGQVF